MTDKHIIPGWLKKVSPITLISSLVFIAGLVTGSVAAVDELDKMVLTEFEFAESMAQHENTMHPLAELAIYEIKSWNRCDRLERRYSELEGRRWREEQAERVNAVTVRDIQHDLNGIKSRFDALKCARILAK